MSKQVFISMGIPSTAAQKEFRDALEQFIRDHGLEPWALNSTHYPAGNPLKDIAAAMRKCDGAIIVAFERLHIGAGTEKRGSPSAKPISSVSLTTPWNQIEAAMAYILGLPIFVIAETGLREEGLIEEKHDWYVERIQLSPDSLLDKGVKGRLTEWCKRLEQGTAARSNALALINENITIGQIFQAMTFKFAVWLIGAATGLVVFGMTIDKYLIK